MTPFRAIIDVFYADDAFDSLLSALLEADSSLPAQEASEGALQLLAGRPVRTPRLDIRW